MKKRLGIFVLAALVCLWSAVPVFGLEPGVYVGYNETSYYNPDTGQIDDGGTKNAELGEGMCRSATDTPCLLEVDADGNMWLTVRLLLQSSCSDVHLYTRTGYDSYAEPGYDITAENSGNDSVDYRFQIDSLPARLMATMYVTPMGRDVLWFMTCDDFHAGSGDFQVMIDLNAAKAAASGGSSHSQAASSAGQPSSYDDNSSAKASTGSSSSAKTSSAKTSTSSNSASSNAAAKTTGAAATAAAKTENKDKADAEKDKDQAQEEDADQTEDAAEAEEDAADLEDAEAAEDAEDEGGSGTAAVVAVLILAALAAAGAVLWKKKGQEWWTQRNSKEPETEKETEDGPSEE